MDGIDIPLPGATATYDRYRMASPAPRRPSWLRRKARLLSFILLVVAPTAGVGVYFFAFAADQYVSEAKFVVRGPTAQAQGMLSTACLQTDRHDPGAQEDTYAVQEYITSRATR